MGSLTSRPKVPKQQPQIVYVPAPVQSAPVSSSVSQASPQVTQDPEPTPEEKQSEARKQNLLIRERGRFGTVNTSFRGVLGLAGQTGQGKTLLGE